MEKLKAAGYARVSTIGQLDGTSPEEQKRVIEQECAHRGYELFKFYSDAASGKNTDRPQLQRLLSDAKDKKFQVLLFTRLDRLGRNLRDMKNILYEISDTLGIDFICIEQPQVSGTGPTANLMLNTLSAFAEFERTIIRDRTGAGRDAKRKNGTAFIGQPPFGYRWDEKINSTIIIPEEKKICLKIHSMYLDQHYSMREIAEKLSMEGIPPPSVTSKRWKTNKANRWNIVTIGKILKNPAYKGETFHNRNFYETSMSKSGKQYMHSGKSEKPSDKWVLVKFPPMVPEERWNLIQARIQNQKIKKKKVISGHEDHFLAENFLYCGECGGRMNKRNPKKKGEKISYACYWHDCSQKELKLSGKKKCILKAQEADKIDNSILAEILKFFTDPGNYAGSWLKDINLEESNNKLKGLEKRKKELENALKRGYELITQEDDLGTRGLYIKNQEKDKEEYKQIQTELRNIENDVEFAQNKVDRVEQFKNALDNAGRRDKSLLYYKARDEFYMFFENLPFKEKKRIVEAIISPENGGNCKVRYTRPIDVIDPDVIDNFPSEKKHKLYEPNLGWDPDIYLDFKADLNKIEALITGLDRKGLLNKFSKS